MKELNCIIIDDEPHAIEEIRELIDNTPGITLSASFQNARDAINYLHTSGQVNVVFSDINMPAMNGIDAAQLLNAYCDFLVYITAHRDYAVDAFAVEASGYLMKPLRQADFMVQVSALVSKKKSYLQMEKEDNVLFVKGANKNSFIKIFLNDIIYIEAMLNYVKIYTHTGTITTYIGLKDIETKLAVGQLFFRVAKSTVISIKHLERLEGNMAFMQNKGYFHIGVKYRNAIHTFLKDRLINP